MASLVYNESIMIDAGIRQRINGVSLKISIVKFYNIHQLNEMNSWVRIFCKWYIGIILFVQQQIPNLYPAVPLGGASVSNVFPNKGSVMGKVFLWWRRHAISRPNSWLAGGINLLVAINFEGNFRYVISKVIIVIDNWGTFCENALG